MGGGGLELLLLADPASARNATRHYNTDAVWSNETSTPTSSVRCGLWVDKLVSYRSQGMVPIHRLLVIEGFLSLRGESETEPLIVCTLHLLRLRFTRSHSYELQRTEETVKTNVECSSVKEE